jgi:hypothetical protein
VYVDSPGVCTFHVARLSRTALSPLRKNAHLKVPGFHRIDLRWRGPITFLGKPVRVCAATHDTGIEFSAENRTFIHKIDSLIDRERAKVVNDLIFGGRVKGLALIDRPAVPKETKNATGDVVKTDGRMAVVLLQ